MDFLKDEDSASIQGPSFYRAFNLREEPRPPSAAKRSLKSPQQEETRFGEFAQSCTPLLNCGVRASSFCLAYRLSRKDLEAAWNVEPLCS